MFITALFNQSFFYNVYYCTIYSIIFLPCLLLHYLIIYFYESDHLRTLSHVLLSVLTVIGWSYYYIAYRSNLEPDYLFHDCSTTP